MAPKKANLIKNKELIELVRQRPSLYSTISGKSKKNQWKEISLKLIDLGYEDMTGKVIATYSSDKIKVNTSVTVFA